MAHTETTRRAGAFGAVAGGSFEELYRRESVRVRAFLLRRTHDAELASDLAAETFTYAYLKWRTLHGRTRHEQKAWLFTVARNRLINHLRRRSVERRALRRLGGEACTCPYDDLCSIEEREQAGELRRSLAHQLCKLGPRQRSALELRIVQGREYADVARELGISQIAARSRVSRALRTLSRMMDRQTDVPRV